MQPDRESQPGFNLVRWSVDHPHTVAAFFIAMLILGWLAIQHGMPRRLMPYVESPLIGIVTESSGRSAEEMEKYFSTPIEQRMTNISGVRFIRSVSQDGFSLVTLEFAYGANMQRAQTDVQSLLNIVQADLPATGANLKPSWVLRVDPLNLPVLTLSLTGDRQKGWSLARLRELADNEVLNRLKRAHPNIYTVSTFGGHRRQLQIVIDGPKLAAYGLSALDIREALDKTNLAKSGGAITDSTSETIIQVDSLLDSAESVANVPLKAEGAEVVRIGDVAEVKDAIAERRSSYRHLHAEGSDEAIAVNVLQNPDASSPVTINAVMKTIRELEAEFPGIKFDIAYNNASFVDTLFGNMVFELLLAIFLTGVVVLFFLGQVRGTLIALTAIPTSLAMSLIAMTPFGMSLNSSTLIGLLIAIGRLVDDAIIDIHAVERHLRMGKDRRTATIDGITEVRRSVLAATIVLIIAMVPLMLSGGITQLMFVGLCLPIVFGLIFSYFVSMTLTATLCSQFLIPHSGQGKGWLYRIALGPFERFLRRMEAGYERLIRWLLKHRFANFVRVGLTVIVGFGFYYFIGSEMMPLADVGQASLQMEMQPGSSFAETERGTKKLEAIIREEGLNQGWITNASLELGVESGPGMTTGGAYLTGYQMNQISGVSGMLTLTDKGAGRPDVFKIMDKIQARALKEIPNIRRIQIKEMGSDVMATSLSPIALVVHGDDLDQIYALAKKTLKIAESESVNPATGKPDIAQPFLSWEMTRPVYKLNVDNDKAASLGVRPVDVAEQAEFALRGSSPMEFYRLGTKRFTSINIRFEKSNRDTEEDLDGLYIKSETGAMIPLSEIASVEKVMAPSAIEHDQLRRAISFGGYYRKDGRPSMDATMDVQMRAMSKLNWPPGYGIDARGDMTQMMDSFRVLLGGLVLALVMMYLVLVAQFKSFLQPLQMVLSLPLELSGVFFMLWVMHQSFSTVSILGVIILSGMDIVTAILMIDLILAVRKSGVPRDEAVATACPQRLRPILMTSLITIVVMLQISFWPKSGLDAYQPLGTVIVGGLIVGTLLSLVDIPIMHTVVDDMSNWLRSKISKTNSIQKENRGEDQ